MEDHTTDWLRVVPISGLGQTMNSTTYRCVLCYRVFPYSLFRSRAHLAPGLAGKEVDIGLGGGRDKPLRPVDMLLYSWDEGLDVCVDVTGSSPLTQTGMIDFAPRGAVIEAAQRKRVKYEAKCADIGYDRNDHNTNEIRFPIVDILIIRLSLRNVPREYLHTPTTETTSSSLAPLTLEEKVDKIVLSWILFTLFDSLRDRLVVACPKSAKEAWALISHIVKDNKRSRTNALKAELRSIKLGD
ncbi:hypothetical protein Tco_0488081 [Tanacetum coccineum]